MAYANSADPDQTDPSWSTLFAIPLSILRKNYIFRPKSKNKVFEILGHLR